jgi:hypothetical protein
MLVSHRHDFVIDVIVHFIENREIVYSSPYNCFAFKFSTILLFFFFFSFLLCLVMQRSHNKRQC